MASISQPRCIRRIKNFIKAGFEVEIYGFDRGLYNDNAYIEGHTINILDSLPSGKKYLQKFFLEKKSLSKLFSRNDPNILYYAFSFDIALICLLNKKEIIYEISDLVYTYFPSKLLICFFRYLDRVIIKKSFLTVMTSKGFSQYLFNEKVPPNIFIQQNKLSDYFNKVERSIIPFSHQQIIFSYIGSFRYPDTVFRFAKVIGKYYPQHSFHFYGDSILTSEVKKMARTYPNIKYFGSFKNPYDLKNIYEKVNIVVACYDTKSINERIAEPNKLFESLFFNKPIVVSKGTFLAKQVVENYKCGFEISATTDENIKSFIDSLETIDFQRIMQHISSISINEIVEDYTLLIKYIENKISEDLFIISNKG